MAAAGAERPTNQRSRVESAGAERPGDQRTVRCAGECPSGARGGGDRAEGHGDSPDR